MKSATQIFLVMIIFSGINMFFGSAQASSCGGMEGGGGCGDNKHKSIYINASSSWDQIIETPNVVIDFYVIPFPNVGVPIYKVCLEPDGVTLNGGLVDVCTRLDYNQKPPACVASNPILQRTSVNSETQFCTSQRAHGCDKWENAPSKISLNYEVPVYEPVGHKIDTGYPDFTKPFTIPACAPAP